RSVVRSHRRVSGRRGAPVPPPPPVPEKRSPIIEGVATRMRLDRLLVEKGLLDSREKALRSIMAGDVLVDGQRADKAGALVSTEAELELKGRSPYVSRGGEKLVHALEHFGISVKGRICVDVGASTGGFTDCLLQRGASMVYAVDVGSGQLDERLRKDARVVVMEHTNARTLDPRLGGTASPLRGPKGNREFCLHLSMHGRTTANLEGIIDRTVQALA